MPTPPSLGTANASPGAIQHGQLTAFQHPTGLVEFFPVIIAQGLQDGPCLWLTAGIHGPEHGGPVVIFRLITPELVKRLRGTIIAVPALNPVGLRMNKYQPYHESKDPNRLWPDGKPQPSYDPDKDPPSPLEQAYQRLFDQMLESADFLIDFHNAWTNSISFAFQDRILYHPKGDGSGRLEAEALSQRQMEMLRAYGHTIIRETPIHSLFDDNRHRSTSSALLYLGRIPTITVELGTGYMPDPAIINASVAGTRNILRWAGMLDDPMEAIEEIKVIDPGYPVRWLFGPRVDEAGVVIHLVEAGDPVQVGQPIAEIRDIWGRPLGDGYIYSQYDGYVIGREHGILYYPGSSVLGLAVRDDEPLIVPYPQDYFKA